MGNSPQEIAQRYDHLSLAQIEAALAYYVASRPEIDAALEQQTRLEESLADEYPSYADFEPG